ncbi:transporter substrate-binding domain-containing protein [Bifidobacterium moukalabense]|uniref:transporter substrate-binding domain-containing protein n=1 Tax=Bifidobacterium moukalabense TaxID=1333651 RepID=UPI0010F55AF7|nr:transporter substrate-binding domain-containing protein [Bifidobacterium moukalabense]
MAHGMRNIAAMLCAVSIMIGTGACGTSISVVTNGQAQGPTITIGVATDQPGLGLLHGKDYSGFDITVARYVAQYLGFADKQVVFTKVIPSTRVSALTSGDVDMVVDSFAMDASYDDKVTFAGPYLTVRRDLLIRGDSADVISGVDDLDGKTVCTAKGGTYGSDMRNLAASVTVEERDTYPQCVTSLMIGEADAIVSDDAILTGLAADRGNGYLQVVGNPFGEESYGIAVRHGESELAGQIDAALKSMLADDSWKSAVRTMKQEIGYTTDASLNPPTVQRKD